MKSKHTYSLPLKKNTIYLAISDPTAHYSHWQYSIDFSIDFNVPILAALGGEIIDAQDESSEGGNDEKFAANKYNNYITIKHKQNELSQYSHIAYKSAVVKIGDNVKRGDMIASGIGMVGRTTAPHLHMMVCFDTDNDVGFESLEIQFDTEIKIIRTNIEHRNELAKPRFFRLMKLLQQYQSK